VCAVGAGPAERVTARALERAGLGFAVDRRPRVGGIWNLDDASSPMYDSTQFTSPKDAPASPL
jgi:cation diffusion facilitator CzcD-associated flavoprotein CzcO